NGVTAIAKARQVLLHAEADLLELALLAGDAHHAGLDGAGIGPRKGLRDLGRGCPQRRRRRVERRGNLDLVEERDLGLKEPRGREPRALPVLSPFADGEALVAIDFARDLERGARDEIFRAVAEGRVVAIFELRPQPMHDEAEPRAPLAFALALA